jgi:hypothetical protein
MCCSGSEISDRITEESGIVSTGFFIATTTRLACVPRPRGRVSERRQRAHAARAAAND